MPPLSEPGGDRFVPCCRHAAPGCHGRGRPPGDPIGQRRGLSLRLTCAAPTSAVVVHGFAALPVLASNAGIIYEWLGSFRDEGAGHDLRLFKGIGR